MLSLNRTPSLLLADDAGVAREHARSIIKVAGGDYQVARNTHYKNNALTLLRKLADVHPDCLTRYMMRCGRFLCCACPTYNEKASQFLDDLDKAKFDAMVNVADAGNAELQFNVGKWYLAGSRAVSKDVNAALDYFYKAVMNAADNAYASQSQTQIEFFAGPQLCGYWYLIGNWKAIGMMSEINGAKASNADDADAQALNKMLARADAGEIEFQFKVGEWLCRGSRGVPQDVSCGLDYLILAINNEEKAGYQDNALAELATWDTFHKNAFFSQHLPFYGIHGTEKATNILDDLDRAEFAKIKAKADDEGGRDAEAQFEAATWLIEGSRGVPQDRDNAFDYLYACCRNRTDKTYKQRARDLLEYYAGGCFYHYFYHIACIYGYIKAIRLVRDLDNANEDHLVDDDRAAFDAVVAKANEGHAESEFKAGEWLCRGSVGVPENIERGAEYLRLAFSHGYKEAMVTLEAIEVEGCVGACLPNEIVKKVLDDLDKARFEELASNNDPQSQYSIACWLTKGSRGVLKNEDKALDVALEAYFNVEVTKLNPNPTSNPNPNPNPNPI